MLQSQAALNQLVRFLTQDSDLREFAEWITSAVDDDSLIAADVNALEGIRLLLTEYGEELRSLDELKAALALVLGESIVTVASTSQPVPNSQFTFTELSPA